MHLALALDHLGPQLRLDCFREIDSGDQKFVVLRDDGKAEPVSDAVHNRFAALERELELVPAVIEHDGFACRINVPQKAVELGDIVSAQVVTKSDLDDLPVSIGLRTFRFGGSRLRRRGCRRR